MASASAIEHTGIIESINSNDIRIRFVSLSACASCHAKGYCSASDMEEKEVMVHDITGEYHVGETVNVVMERSLGYKALLIGYVYPFIIVMILLLSLSAVGTTELKTGLIALGALLPYYLIVYLLRNRINRKFSFSIRKNNYE